MPPTPMRIDSHQHFWRYSSATHGWIDESMGALKRDFLPEHFEPLLKGQGFDACIAVQAAQTIDETRWLLELASRHAFIAGVVGWVDLCSIEVERVLDKLARDPHLVGVRHVVQDEPDDAFMLRPDFQRGIAALARFDLVYDILIYPRQLPAAIQLARAFPEQSFVLDHLGKPEIRARRIEPWAGGLRELARSPNVVAKLSGLVTEARWRSWSPSDLHPYVDAALEAFGPRRLMIGSDWPVCTLAGDHRAVINAATQLLDGLSSDERAAVLGENARRMYLRSGRAGFNAPTAPRVDALSPPTAP